jgi:enoyl-CoA hydratase/carnithine racemase
VGASLASKLLLTGRFIQAERALQTGLDSSVVPDADHPKAARQLDVMHFPPLVTVPDTAR